MAKKINFAELRADQVLSLIPTLPIETVNLKRFGNVDKGLNYREANQYVARSPDLADMMQREGQREPLTGTDNGDDDGTIEVLQGNLRVHAFMHARDKKMSFVGGKYAGEPMAENVEIRIIHGKLSPEVKAHIRADHGGVTLLSRRGLASTVIDLTRKQLSEKDVILKVKGVYDQHYPLSAEVLKNVKPITEDGGESYAKARHGRAPLMVWQAIARGPKVLEDAYLNRLAGMQSWPKDDEARELVRIYEAEVRDDATRKIGYLAPGSEFTRRWDEMMAEWAKADAAGTRSKSQSALNGTQMKQRRDASTRSRMGKVICDTFLKGTLGDAWATIDSFLLDIESDAKFAKPAAEILDRLTAAIPADDAQTGTEPTVAEEAATDVRQQGSDGSKRGKREAVHV